MVYSLWGRRIFWIFFFIGNPLSSAPAIFDLWCGGGDSNPRTPSRPDLESGAVDLAWLPPQSKI